MCDEATNSTTGQVYLCRAGYVCVFGTTPETSLEATAGQFRMMCPPGFVCQDGTTFANGSIIENITFCYPRTEIIFRLFSISKSMSEELFLPDGHW